jgi:serine carboxypeptidase-like clade 1
MSRLLSRCFASSAAALVLMLFAATCVRTAPTTDLVAKLPDFPGALPSKHYSGYLNALNGSHLHYYLVEATEVDPATAPLVWWTNGGPGCSSMDGWGYELGPFHFKNYNASGPTFALNNYTWTRLANVVFVEDPPGVGFSYRDDGNYTISDSLNAENNHAALVDLLTNKFPEYAGNEFYVAGESYGGIYVPTLAHLVLTKGFVQNFTGIIVGNGVTSATYDDNFYWSDAVFAHGHGFMTDETLAQVKAACVPPSGNPNGATCNALQADYYTMMAPDVNTYDYIETCFAPPTPSDLYLPAARRRIVAHAKHVGVTPLEYIALAQLGGSLQQIAAAVTAHRIAYGNGSIPPSPPGFNVPCIDSQTMMAYLNRDDVKAALHVEKSLSWAICSSVNYKSNILDVVFVYNELLKAKKRVLIYNGNTDMSVPYTGTRAWMAHETNWTVTRPLQGWSFTDPAYPWGPQQGGFAVQYEADLWFTLVNGAGHMVPQFRPPAAFAMFERFITKRGF